jgi:hypothetical protein
VVLAFCWKFWLVPVVIALLPLWALIDLHQRGVFSVTLWRKP